MTGAVKPAPAAVVGDLEPASFDEAVGVLARGMRDNPIHVAAYGTDPARRERCHARLTRALLVHARHNRPIGVWREQTLVACSAVLFDGACRPGPATTLRMLPSLAALGPRTALRVHAWVSAWQARDPEMPHAHIGPLAVERNLQGLGFGSVLLDEVCRRLDAAQVVGWLETDKERNVPFYERGGFRVVEEATVLGVPCWFMQRTPAGRDPAGPASR